MMYIKLLALVFLLAPAALLAQGVEGRWHVVQVPLSKDAPHVVFTVEKAAISLSYEPKDALTDEDRKIEAEHSNMKILWKTKSGDTSTFHVKAPQGTLGLRLIRETPDRSMLYLANNPDSSVPKYLRGEYYFYGIVSDDAEWANLLKLRDPATISREHVLFILKDMRDLAANMKAAHDFEKKLKDTWSTTLAFELGKRVTDDLEALGYSPVRWSRDPIEVLDMHRAADPQVAQLYEELRQLRENMKQ